MKLLKDLCLIYIHSNYSKYKESLKLLPIDLRYLINYHHFECTQIKKIHKKIKLLPLELHYLIDYHCIGNKQVKKLKCTMKYDYAFSYYKGDILGLAHETSTYDLIISYLVSIDNDYYLILYSGADHCDYYNSFDLDIWYQYNLAFFFDCNIFVNQHISSQKHSVLRDNILVKKLYETCYRINNNPYLESRLKWFDSKSMIFK